MSRLLIQISHLYKSFGPTPLLDDISLSIHQGEVFALIGENGCGKTTLLKILTGEEGFDSGILQKTSPLTIGFLPQEMGAYEGTVRAFIAEGPLFLLEQQMGKALEEERLEEWNSLHDAFEGLGGYHRLPLEKVFSGLKLETLLDKSMKVLSSGERVRVGLAKALMANSDLLLLDEPTNHLDQEMLLWLQETLLARSGATVIVSHDRQFLNAACNRLIEIKKGRLFCYGGNYDYYVKEKERLIEKQIKAHEEQEEEWKELKRKIKALTFSKKKPPPPKDRNIMAYDKRGAQYEQSVQRNLVDLKTRLEEIEKNLIPHPLPKNIKGLYFEPVPLQGVLECSQIAKGSLFSNFSLQLKKGDRIVLMGPNGSGKTTLMNCLAGLLPVDSGTIHKNRAIKIAYLDQEVDRLPMEQSPLAFFERKFHLSKEALLKELHKAALESNHLDRPFSSLSVGERKRLMLLNLILEKPNVLLLDEPTNHLDLLTLEALEKALLNFEGALFAISHDQTFVKKIATHLIWV